MYFNKKKCNIVASIFLLVSTVDASFAGAMGESKSYFKGHFLVQIGGYSAIQGTEQDIFIRENLAGNLYTVETHNQGSGLVGVGYLLDGPVIRDRFPVSYGVDAFFLGQTSIYGYIVEEHNDTNLSYRYKIQNIPLYAVAKTLINTRNEHFKIAVDAGIGPNFISASKYREIPLTSYTIPDNAFKDNNNVALSATAGASIRFSLGQVPLEFGYRFFYLGQGKFSITNEQVINAVKTGTNYANAFVCSVTI